MASNVKNEAFIRRKRCYLTLPELDTIPMGIEYCFIDESAEFKRS